MTTPSPRCEKGWLVPQCDELHVESATRASPVMSLRGRAAALRRRSSSIPIMKMRSRDSAKRCSNSARLQAR